MTNAVLVAVDDDLWLSDAKAAKNEALLKQHRIDVIVNIASQLRNTPSNVQVVAVHFKDAKASDVAAEVRRAVAAIAAARAENKRVLNASVHALFSTCRPQVLQV